jgi:hypothetical protein
MSDGNLDFDVVHRATPPDVEVNRQVGGGSSILPSSMAIMRLWDKLE